MLAGASPTRIRAPAPRIFRATRSQRLSPSKAATSSVPRAVWASIGTRSAAGSRAIGSTRDVSRNERQSLPRELCHGGRRKTPSLVGLVLGRYRLERHLGEGGMGVVYAARHQDLGRAAAVKVLHEHHDTSEQVRRRFLREGQAAARIRHPNIVDVYDVGTEAGRIYLVMELLVGEDLRSLLAREGPLSERRTADLLVPVIAAVAAAHDHGVVHRDLK